MIHAIIELMLYDEEEVEVEHTYEIQCIEAHDVVEILIISDDGLIIVVEVRFLHINIVIVVIILVVVEV